MNLGHPTTPSEGVEIVETDNYPSLHRISDCVSDLPRIALCLFGVINPEFDSEILHTEYLED